MPNFGLGALRRLIHHSHHDDALDPACKIPLTERNIQFLNESTGSSTKDDDEVSDLGSCRHASERVLAARVVRVSEWLKVSPTVQALVSCVYRSLADPTSQDDNH